MKLKKTIYGLKQAPIVWNSRIDKYFQINGFSKYQYEHALYCKGHKNEDILIVCLYVDYLIFISNNPSMFEYFKKTMTKEFEMIDIGTYGLLSGH